MSCDHVMELYQENLKTSCEAICTKCKWRPSLEKDPNLKYDKLRKPFDIEKALAGDPVVTRDGRKIREIHIFKTASADADTLYAVIEGEVEHFRKDGVWIDDKESDLDLFMAPKIKKIKMKLYRTNNGHYDASDSTATFIGREFIKEIEIEVEE